MILMSFYWKHLIVYSLQILLYHLGCPKYGIYSFIHLWPNPVWALSCQNRCSAVQGPLWQCKGWDSIAHYWIAGANSWRHGACVSSSQKLRSVSKLASRSGRFAGILRWRMIGSGPEEANLLSPIF